VTPNRRPWPAAAGIVGCLSFVLIGWSGLLVPSLIRSIKDTFDQSDAGIGVFYFVYAAVYAAGSLGGGLITERFGRRRVLSVLAALHGLGFIGFGLAPSWAWFLIAALPAGLGAGGLDGGGNGLILDLYQSRRGRALNLLHLFFSLGALSAPLAVGRLVDSGVAWPSIATATGLAALAIGAAFLVVPMPDGRVGAIPADPVEASATSRRLGDRLAAPLILLAIAISCYVASEVGVSNWLVRFLEPAPITVATTALSLFWAGLAIGRLFAARFADRFDHIRFAAAASVAMSIALLGAILVPSLPASIAMFALAGVATGPVFPMIIAIGGDRYPDRTSAVSGFLSSAAVVGSIVYPPVMGFLSVSVGLTVAMLGTVLLGLASAGALMLVGRWHPPAREAALEDPGRVDFGQPPVMLSNEPSEGEGTR
jgi:fucose permease